MSEDAQSDKVVDFKSNPKYEERLVIFYDVLGWRSHIGRAGKDVERLGQLRRLLLRQLRGMSLRREMYKIRVSTFSDNVVITKVLSENSERSSEKSALLIQQMTFFQIAAAVGGFLLRGGITVGDVVHDDEVVFGPGLNRAYYLESEVAEYPRFVVDEVVTDRFNLGHLPVVEDGVRFLDPFRIQFCNFMLGQNVGWDAEGAAAIGLPPGKREILDRLDGSSILRLILDRLKPQIQSPIEDQIYVKLSWLFDRIAKQLGVPRSKSYRRVYPTGGAV